MTSRKEKGKNMSTGLYETDFYGWTVEQSERLRYCCGNAMPLP